MPFHKNPAGAQRLKDRSLFGQSGYRGMQTDVLDARVAYERERAGIRPWHSIGGWVALISLHIYAVLFATYPLIQQIGRINVLFGCLSLLPVCAYYGTRRLWRGDPSAFVMGIVLMLASLPNALFVVSLIDWALVPGGVVRGAMVHPSFPWVLGALPGGLLWIAFSAKSSILNHYRNRAIWEHLRAGIEVNERKLAEARLGVLQAQIEPHFLYNTLANVQHLIARKPEDAEAMLTGLIRYLRESLPKMRDSCSTLGQEFALSTAYLDIARIRLGGRLTVETSLPTQLQACSFPPLVIQTLVENALKHGVEPKVGPTTIQVSAEAQQDEVCVVVADDGVGLGQVQGTGVGLRNTRERLTAIYGTKARLTLAPNSPSGVIATITIPQDSPCN